jgi:hypothetical protein
MTRFTRRFGGPSSFPLLPLAVAFVAMLVLGGCGPDNLVEGLRNPLAGLPTLLIVIADVYAIVQIVQSRATTGSKLLWSLFVVIAPCVGLIAWYLAGPKR